MTEKLVWLSLDQPQGEPSCQPILFRFLRLESNRTMSTNPYQSPYAKPSGHGTMAVKSNRPGQLTFVAILAIVMGLFGILGTGCGVIGLAFQSIAVSAIQQNAPPGKDPEVLNMLKSVQSHQNAYMIAIAGVMALGFVVASILMTGGIGLLANKSWAIWVLLGAFGVAILYILAQFGLNIFIQLSLQEKLKSMVGNASPPGQEIGTAIGMVLGGLFVFAKVALYSVCMFFLLQPSARRWANANR
jgi:hypothetical protein